MKNIQSILVVLAIGAVVSGCGMSDLRPDEQPLQQTTNSEQRGRAILTAMCNAHGGSRAFYDAGAYRAQIVDDWSPLSFPFTLLAPFDDDVLRYDMVQKTGTEDTRMTFHGGDLDGVEWGVQNWVTYRTEAQGPPIWEDDDTIRFTGPAIGYFIQAPFRLNEADYVHALGTAKLNGKTYDKVFVSWGDQVPQEEVDQMIAWVEQDTKRLGFLEFTVRQQASFAKGAMELTDYRQVDGVWVAHTMKTVENPGDEEVQFHTVTIEKFELGIAQPESFIIPDPNRKRPKFI